MYRITFPKLVVYSAVFFLSAAGVYSQGQLPAGPPRDAGFERRGPEQRPNLFRALGLSQDQIQAIRTLNRERQPVEHAARKRFQEANRELNMIIYADNVDEALYQARLAEYQAAQGELARLKFANELAVRKLLTPAQLVRFRELRRRFAEVRENAQDRSPSRPSERPVHGAPGKGDPPNND